MIFEVENSLCDSFKNATFIPNSLCVDFTKDSGFTFFLINLHNNQNFNEEKGSGLNIGNIRDCGLVDGTGGGN
jgi:hypothetical protein